ncbi:hypothetical protein GC175_10190 [bacterium]|nr:hypothetical protein [bacterium]
MFRSLIIKVRFDLSSRTWEKELSTALQLFWLGDFEAAVRAFEQLMQKSAQFLSDIEQKPNGHWEQQRIQKMRSRVLHTTHMVIAGRWAIAYLSGKTTAAHPSIPEAASFSDAAWQFIVNVHLALCNTYPEVLRLYAKTIHTWDEPDREKQIQRLVLSAPRSLEAIEVMRALFRKRPDDEQIAHHLCGWLLEEGWITEFTTTADIYLASRPADLVILDMLAYVAESHQEWSKARFLYAKTKNYERAAFMAFLDEDQAGTSEHLRAIPPSARQSSICYICQGWLAFVQRKYNTAIDIWVH